MKNTILITGASGGIGREFARIHAGKGGDVIAVSRDEIELEELKQELEQAHGIQVMVVIQDLTESHAARKVYDRVKEAGVEVDYLINNAGFGGIGIFHERDIERDLSMIQLNIVALTELTHLFLRDFVARDKGRILNVSSIASLMAGPMQAVYFATKAYVTFFSNAIAEELHDSSVTVTNLMPGATDTEFGKVSGMENTPLFQNPVSPRKVAEEGYRGMMDGKLDVVSGLPWILKALLPLRILIPKHVLNSQIRKSQTVK